MFLSWYLLDLNVPKFPLTIWPSFWFKIIPLRIFFLDHSLFFLMIGIFYPTLRKLLSVQVILVIFVSKLLWWISALLWFLSLMIFLRKKMHLCNNIQLTNVYACLDRYVMDLIKNHQWPQFFTAISSLVAATYHYWCNPSQEL